MPTHKMQSGHGAPTISLQLVPKMLAPLVSLWVPHAFVVSFKLETDENLLISKSRESLNKYRHNLVIANLMQTRKHRVIFVTPDTSYEVVLSKEQAHSGLEIEEPIVADVVSGNIHDAKWKEMLDRINQSILLIYFRSASTVNTWMTRATDKRAHWRYSTSRRWCGTVCRTSAAWQCRTFVGCWIIQGGFKWEMSWGFGLGDNSNQMVMVSICCVWHDWNRWRGKWWNERI